MKKFFQQDNLLESEHMDPGKAGSKWKLDLEYSRQISKIFPCCPISFIMRLSLVLYLNFSFFKIE